MRKKLSTMMATAAAVALFSSVTPAEAASKQFSDVSVDHMFHDEIISLADLGVIAGFPDGSFQPEAPVTREQAAILIANALDLDLENLDNPNFSDVSETHMFYKQIAAVQNNGIMNGYGGGKFGPSNTLTRAEVASILTRAYNLTEQKNTPFTDVPATEWFAGSVGALYTNEITSGTSETTFSPKGTVTRGQMAAFLYRSYETTLPWE
ncbi:S-layer homology domain-containing protein [Bacillus manliponensis]|uniref:S-layer homology domain-containing protein n=1 Tax=Bacillus manliponensis TaxID=574376 RepID=UPI00068A01E1|nr:S-layer homology domain-containing protein [Bacillus manliponensis]